MHNRIYPIGIDVSSQGVRMLQLRHGRAGWQVIAAAQQEFEEPLGDDLQQRHHIMSDAVRKAKAKSEFDGSDCISCLCTSDMLFRAVRLPHMSDDELDKAASWEAADRFNMEVDNLQTIWIRAGEVSQGTEARDEVILVSVPRKLVETHLDALIENRLRPIAVDASFAAVTRATCRTLRRKTDLSTVQMLVDIGADVSSVIVTRGNQFAFLKTIQVGGGSFNSAVARALNMTEAEAADVRRRRMRPRGSEVDDPADKRVDRAVFEAVRPFIHNLAQEIALCLRYYSVTFRGARPDVVKVVGADAAEPNLTEILTDHLKIQTEVARPFEGIDISRVELGSDRRDACHAEWATAFGLSLRGQSNTLLSSRTRQFAHDKSDAMERGEEAA